MNRGTRMRLLLVTGGQLFRSSVSEGIHGQACLCQRVYTINSSWLGEPRGDRKYMSTWASFSTWRFPSTTLSTDQTLLKRNRNYVQRFLSTDGPEMTGSDLKALKKIKGQESTAGVFYDSLRIYVKGGNGGQGLQKKGGIGGKGGDVVAVGHKNVTLKKVSSLNSSKRYVAEHGSDSKFFCLYGTPGKNLILPVPLGVSIITELGHKVGEINKHGEKLVVAKGGAGGGPSNKYCAETGQSHNVFLDLKLIADVGFVGFPNAGKSTLLKAISGATPKIASYPFTTIRPNVGVIEYTDYRQISLADLPGLIEGAHANIGMGHKFLKHVERTKLLLFVVDIHGFQLGPKFPSRSALETIVLLNKELELYKEELTEKPAILALNKCDLPGSYNMIKRIEETVREQSLYEAYLKTLPKEIVPENVLMFDKIVPISAKTDPISVNELKNIIRQVIDDNASESEAIMQS